MGEFWFAFCKPKLSFVDFDSRKMPDHSRPSEICECCCGWGKRSLYIYMEATSSPSLFHSYPLACLSPSPLLWELGPRKAHLFSPCTGLPFPEGQGQCSKEHISFPQSLFLSFEAIWGSLVGWVIVFRLWLSDDSHSCGLPLFTTDIIFQLDFPFPRKCRDKQFLHFYPSPSACFIWPFHHQYSLKGVYVYACVCML